MELLSEPEAQNAMVSLVMGASYSVDILATAGYGFAHVPTTVITEDLFAMADERLNLRSVVGIDFSDKAEHFQKHNRYLVGDLVCELGARNWNLRTVPSFHDDHFVLIDNEAAIFASKPVKQGDTGLYLTYEEKKIANFRKRFELAWASGAELGLLYQEHDQEKIVDAAYNTHLLTISNETWNRLIRDLQFDPEKLYALEPRQFEELIAELLDRQGLKVKLTPSTKDGGRDILAFADTVVGEHLFYVECKRFSPQNPVDVGLVRKLYGVVEADRATAGILVTTSRFTEGAHQFQQSVRNRLSLKEYRDVVDWLRKDSNNHIIG